MSRRKKEDHFKKFLKTYVMILTILMIVAIIYVINSLITYKNLQVDNYLASTVNNLINAGEKEQLSKYVDLSSIKLGKFESKNDKPDKAIAEALKTNDLEYKLNKDSIDLNNPVYDVIINGTPFLNITLNGEKKISRLGLLTMQDWKVDKIEVANSNGSIEYTIEVPNDYKVYVNDIEVGNEEKSNGEVSDDLNELSKYANLPLITKYTISNLIKEPKVRIEDKDGKEVEYTKQDTLISIELETETIEDEKTALERINGDIDIMKIAEDWSLYLTNDLGGTLHGFYKINKYLIKDSYMYKYAYKWATNVDITFISNHSLANPVFTNEKVSNFKIYNENAFSCEVYLEKNMIIGKRGNNNKLQDVLYERMYFVKYEGEWKLVSMQSLAKNK